ncbi:hypothetical protein L6452_08304 [Arctium lappa]|uniref:Uncharacterized protein n=1 Tax=Arctium lappa TaxID=4217 RepID=A0ACB9DHR5_ARCLA|nr:hypothetical protein L6452_08304 [Arctium lappa]
MGNKAIEASQAQHYVKSQSRSTKYCSRELDSVHFHAWSALNRALLKSQSRSASKIPLTSCCLLLAALNRSHFSYLLYGSHLLYRSATNQVILIICSILSEKLWLTL